MRIILTTLLFITVAGFGPGNGQKTDSAAKVTVTAEVAKTDSVSSEGTKALVAEIGAGKKQIAENIEYFKALAVQKNTDAKRISELEKALLESRAAEAWAKNHPDTVTRYVEPRYDVTKVIFTESKEGGKKKSKGNKVAYDTADAPVFNVTYARNR